MINVYTKRMDIKKEVEDETFDYSIVKEEYSINENATVLVKKIGDPLSIKKEVKYEFIEVEKTSHQLNQPSQSPPPLINILPPEAKDEPLKYSIVKEEYRINENATVSVKKIHQPSKSPPPLIYFTTPAADKSFKCSQSNKSYETRILLNQHSETHTLDVSFPCSICQTPFKSAPSLKKHMSVHRKKRHICEICGKKFFEKSGMKLHIQRIHESNKPAKKVNISKTIECPDPNCFMKFKYQHYLNKHMIMHSTEKPFECPKCPRKFKAKHVFVSHIRFHEQETPRLTCAICNKTFQWKKNMRKHMQEHTAGKGSVTCPHCSQSICKDYLKTHMEKQHKGLPFIEEKENPTTTGKRLQCPQCDKSYEISSSFNRHMLLHKEGVSFQCPICENSFKTSGYLKHHMKIHGETKHDKKPGKKVYICLHCGKHLRDKCRYTNHMKIHEAKTIECLDPNCSMKFKYQHNLDKHMIIHSAEKPFPCPKCPRKFKTKHVLVSHMRLHGKGISTVECDICKSPFRTKNSLQNHMREHIIGKEEATSA